jgi:hypothetical protein
MNRREAMAAIAALPGVASMTILEVRPDQMVIIECAQYLRPEQRDAIRAAWSLAWDGHPPRTAIMDAGMRVRVAAVEQTR